MAVERGEFFAEATFEVPPTEETAETVRVVLAVEPAASLEASLQPPRGAESPRLARLHFRSTDGPTTDRRPSHGSSTCTVFEGSSVRCQAPRGVLDLRLEVPGFAPVHRWAQEMDEEVSWGEVRLRPGASLSGFVVTPERGDDLGQTRIVLLEETATGGGAADDRASFRRPEARVDAEGFFQLAGLRPGLFRLLAIHPEYAVTTLDGVQVAEGRDLRLDPIELQPPAEVELTMTPPTDPYRRPWRFELLATATIPDLELGDAASPPGIGSALDGVIEDGRASIAALTPGDYRLQIFDSRGSRWLSQQHSFFAGGNVVEVETPAERLEGLVLMDEDPLPGAQVTITEDRGNMRMTRRTDEEGLFYVFLKRDARWNVDIVHGAHGVHATFPEVEVPPRDPAERWPSKRFEVPATRVFGDVYDSDGVKETTPTVLDIASLDREPSVSLSKLKPADGFEIRGLAPGRYRISAGFDASATDRRGTSRPIDFSLVDGRELGPLRLEIEDSRRLAGQVVAPTGDPVSGARLFAAIVGRVGEPAAMTLPSAVSDGDGVFELDLPRSAEQIVLTAMAPGHALYHRRHSTLERDGPLVVMLGADAGSLRLSSRDPAELNHGLRRRVFLLAETPIRRGLLDLWSQLHPWAAGAGWHLPAMPAGSYRACLRTAEIQPLLAAVAPLPPTWVDRHCGPPGLLSAGGELHLEIPVEAADASTDDDVAER